MQPFSIARIMLAAVGMVLLPLLVLQSALAVTGKSAPVGSYGQVPTDGGEKGSREAGTAMLAAKEGRTFEKNDAGGYRLHIDPRQIEAQLGQTVAAEVFAAFSGACTGPVAIDIDGGGSGAIEDVTGISDRAFGRLDDPDKIYARLRQEELNAEGENDSDAMLDIKVGADVAADTYEVRVTGRGCGDRRQVSLKIAVAAVDLRVTKRQSRTTLTPGSTQDYELSITNRNHPNLTDLVVTDKLDPRLIYIKDTSGRTPGVNNGVYTWHFRDLGRGESIKFRITTRVDDFARQGVPISNRAEVTAGQLPKPFRSNTVTADMGYVPVDPKGLKVEKRTLKKDARIGGIVTYRVVVQNTGTGPLFDVKLTDKPPQGFTITAITVDGRPVPVKKVGRRKIEVALGNLSAGQAVTLRYHAAVGTNADSGRNINCAEAQARDGGGNTVRGEDCALVMLGADDVGWLGEIKAMAYLDVDGDGVRGSADTPLKGVEFILVPPGHKQISDEDGEARYFELESNTYVVAVNTRTLALPLAGVGDMSKLVRLLEGERGEVLFLFKNVEDK